MVVVGLYIYNPNIFNFSPQQNNQINTPQNGPSSTMNVPSISSINNANNNATNNTPSSNIIPISNTGSQDNIDRIVSNYVDYVDFINTTPYGVGYGIPDILKTYTDKAINDKFIDIDIETYKGSLGKCKDRCKSIESKNQLNVATYPKTFRYREIDTNKNIQFCNNPNDKVIKINNARIGTIENNTPYNDTGEWSNAKLDETFLENILGNSSYKFNSLELAGDGKKDLFPNRYKVLAVDYECSPNVVRYRESDLIKNIKLCKDNQKVIRILNERIGVIIDNKDDRNKNVIEDKYYEAEAWTKNSLSDVIRNGIIGKNSYTFGSLENAGGGNNDLYKNREKILKFNYDCGVDSCGGFSRKKNVSDNDENGECYLKGPIPKSQDGTYLFNFKDDKNEFNHWIKDRQKIGDTIRGMYGDIFNFNIKAV